MLEFPCTASRFSASLSDMKIHDAGPLNKAAPKKANRAGAANGNFRSFLDSGDETVSASNLGGVAPMGMLEGLLAIQQVEEDLVSSEEGKKQGKEALDYLDRIRHGLLSGKLSTIDVQNLMRQVREMQFNVADPRLKEILEDIHTRAAVELAKLEMSEKQGKLKSKNI